MLDLADLRHRLTVGTLPRRDQEAVLAALLELEARAAALDDRLHAVLSARFGPGYVVV